MIWLVAILHVFIGSTLAGSFVIAALVLGYVGVLPIIVAAALGFVLAFPVSWIVGKKLHRLN